MKLPSIPGPGDVLSAVEGLREGIGDALALVPRLGAVVGQVEELVVRVSTLVDRAEGVLDRADSAMTGLDATRARADEIVEGATATQQKADDAIERVGATQQKADDAIERVGATQQKADDAIERVGATQQKADGLVDGMAPLVDDYAEPLHRLAPSVRRLADTLEPHEVEAMVTLVDRLPELVIRLDQTVLPVLANMDNVGDDVHDLLDTMQDLRQVVKGFPGSRLFRRRGAEEIAEEEDEDAAEA